MILLFPHGTGKEKYFQLHAWIKLFKSLNYHVLATFDHCFGQN